MTEQEIEALFERWIKERLSIDVSVYSPSFSSTHCVKVHLLLDGVSFSDWSDELPSCECQ